MSPSVGKGVVAGRARGARVSSPDKLLNWVQCDQCQRWELFDNTGLGGEFDERAVKDIKFICRMCKLESMVGGQYGGECSERLRRVEEELKSLSKRVNELEAVVQGTRTEVEVTGEKLQQWVVKQEVSEASVDDKLKDIRETVDKLSPSPFPAYA